MSMSNAAEITRFQRRTARPTEACYEAAFFSAEIFSDFRGAGGGHLKGTGKLYPISFEHHFFFCVFYSFFCT